MSASSPPASVLRRARSSSHSTSRLEGSPAPDVAMLGGQGTPSPRPTFTDADLLFAPIPVAVEGVTG